MIDIRQIAVEAGRIVRFGIVGTSAALVYAGIAAAAVEIGIAGPITASAIGHVIAGLVSYFGHLRFSFAVNPEHQVFAWRFTVIAVFAFAMNIGITFLTTSVFGLSYWVSIAAVTILIPITNYLCNRFWVFLPGLRPPQVGPA